jgi:hypothetical protein
MRKKYFIMLSTLILLISCNNKEEKFPIEKRYWTVDDYENVVRELRYATKPDESLPRFNDPETKIVIEKLTDEENFRVVLNDKELGLTHKSETAQKFFDVWRSLNETYSLLDKKDMYVYEKESLEIWKFGLELQQEYFKLGNQKINENSDGSESVNKVLSDNVETLIDNSIIYLNVITNEKQFTEDGKKLIAETIVTSFTKLIEENPKADFTNLKNKINLLNKKITDPTILGSLNSLSTVINKTKPKTEIESLVN